MSKSPPVADTLPELHGDSRLGGSKLNEKSSDESIHKATTSTVSEGSGPQDEYVSRPRANPMTSFRMLFSTTARCVYIVVFAANLAAFLWVCSLFRHPENKTLVAIWLGLPVMGNLFAGSQDLVVNLLFAPLAFVPLSCPFFLRRIAAGFLAVETIHAATSISGTVWLILFVVHATREVILGGPISLHTVVLAYIVLSMLIVTLALCLPICVRVMQSKFEYTHRYLAWTAVVLVWAVVICLCADYTQKPLTLGQSLLKVPPFWMFVILTVSCIIPWANLRKVKCEAEVLSNDCVRLHLDGSAPYIGPRVPGGFARISTSPMMNWHIFPMFFDRKRTEKGYSFIIYRSDQWSANMIDNPPAKVWARGYITTGVMRIAPLFRRILVIATGPGICIPAPYILSYDSPTKLVWAGHEINEMYGEEFVECIRVRSNALIHDSRKQGRLDMVTTARQIVREYEPEVVFIFSNKTTVRDITVDLLQSGGVAVYGTVC